ncbi:suppressor of fused domain protein [Bacillus sp. DX4.1]|uniref:suppressor of fused domain protein n=1 Tax=Bacillus sp. DX4.1 TaxID=3055867 RepID=UPI0025A22513|nr:suppressor of fused domain protein [Bacillus sp. DX4.1]MDM5186259.1 suppressor of fused domain protein [Bacillus sp. DX4.1]
MKIWSIGNRLESDQLECYSEQDEELFKKGLRGISLLDVWTPVEMVSSDHGEQTDLLNDMPPIFTKEAIETVYDLIKEKVQVLPLVHDNYDCYLINVINVLDCIDYNHAKPNNHGGFKEYSFNIEKVQGEHIFRTANMRHDLGDFPIVSVETFVSDEFKKRVTNSGLKGFDFDLVWTSDEENNEQPIENNPMIRPTSIEDFESHIQHYYGPITNHIEANTKMVTDVELYDVGPNETVDYHTLVTYRNSYFRMPAPSSVDSGYAELVMHLPKDWEVSTSTLEHSKYGWPLRLLQNFGKDVMRNGYWLGQWLVFPNQSEEDLKQSYLAQLGGAEWNPNAPIQPYSESTEFCGVMIVPPLPQCSGAFKMEFREDGKRIEGDWPIYFHTLLPLYKEEIHCYFTEGHDVLLQKLMKNGVEEVFDLNRENTCK